jgi:hypothetical protein
VLPERAGLGELVVSEHDILDGIALSIRLACDGSRKGKGGREHVESGRSAAADSCPASAGAARSRRRGDRRDRRRRGGRRRRVA